MPDLLHEALQRHALQASPQKGGASPTLPNIDGLSLRASSDGEDELVPVQTPLLSRAATPSGSRNSSRSSSPTRRGGAGKPRRDKTKEREKAEMNKNSKDPMIKFPNTVHGRIFDCLDIEDLLTCGAVCKRWRVSATLNYIWYLRLQEISFVPGSGPAKTYTASASAPLWTKRDSKENWMERYASICRRDDLEVKNVDEVDDGTMTPREMKEAAWKAEEEAEVAGLDKVAMRQYYKNLGNSKVKGKTGKGSAKTWDQDGLGGGGDDYM